MVAWPVLRNVEPIETTNMMPIELRLIKDIKMLAKIWRNLW
jgi:hypothetical protein